MKLKDLFFEFSHNKRYKIFKLLDKECQNHTEIRNLLNLPASEVTRHTQRLIESDLIKRDLKGRFSSTNFGKMLYNILDYIEFSVKFRDFINEHNILTIPPGSLLKIGNLKNCQLLSRTMENIETWSEMIINAEKYIWSISDQLQNSIIPIVQKKIMNKKIQIKAILEKSLLERFIGEDSWEAYLKGVSSEIIEEFFEKLEVPQNVHVKINLNFALTITESETILFLSAERGIDYSQCLYAKNNRNFSEWAKDLFMHCWDESETIQLDDLTD
ncbi:MAG: helix-turn-helix transcriptional regulator [Promethearchaeota archaeon]